MLKYTLGGERIMASLLKGSAVSGYTLSISALYWFKEFEEGEDANAIVMIMGQRPYNLSLNKVSGVIRELARDKTETSVTIWAKDKTWSFSITKINGSYMIQGGGV